MVSKYSIKDIFLGLCLVVLATAAEDQADPTGSPEELFISFFSERRSEHLEVIKGILKYEEQWRRAKLVNPVTKTLFELIKMSRATLENAGFVPGLSKFPEDDKIRDALAIILQNTALFGDIILHMPDIATPLLSSRSEYDVLFKWGLLFMNQTQLLDKKTIKQMSLVSQELNITARSPDYINPYRMSHSKAAQKHARKESEPSTSASKMKKKKKKLPRGPRLSDEL